MMNSYLEMIEKVFKLAKIRRMNETLATISTLCEIYNHPEKEYPTIHVAGTNGKGSVCTKLASIFEKSGYTVGLYTSPHISCYRERIRINGVMISEGVITEIFNDISATAHKQGLYLSFFEITTIISFIYFAKSNVDIAIIETGLGGRLDATNVVDPLLSIITSIGFDHTEILGDTLEKIASEKAGIIKRERPVVIGPHVPYGPIAEKAHEMKSPIYQSRETYQDYDLENQNLVKMALSLVPSSFTIPTLAIEEGIKAKPPCRFEEHDLGIKVILDVAHNPSGFERLKEKLQELYPYQHYRFVLGLSKSKDIEECVKLLRGLADHTHIVSSNHPRLASTEYLSSVFSQLGLPFSIEPSIFDGSHSALNLALKNKEILVITGSFFIMQDARRALDIHEPLDPKFENV